VRATFRAMILLKCNCLYVRRCNNEGMPTISTSSLKVHYCMSSEASTCFSLSHVLRIACPHKCTANTVQRMLHSNTRCHCLELVLHLFSITRNRLLPANTATQCSSQCYRAPRSLEIEHYHYDVSSTIILCTSMCTAACMPLQP
jgi:hypothetical protein